MIFTISLQMRKILPVLQVSYDDFGTKMTLFSSSGRLRHYRWPTFLTEEVSVLQSGDGEPIQLFLQSNKKKHSLTKRGVWVCVSPSIPLTPGCEERAAWQRALEPGQQALWGTRKRWQHSRRRSSLAVPLLASPAQMALRLHCPGTEHCVKIGCHPEHVQVPAERRAEPGSDCWCDGGSGHQGMAYDFSLEKQRI